ncbi:hypothetical protein D3C75_836380 [compost metagenome]
MGAVQPVKGHQSQRHRQNRECRHDNHVGDQRGPGKHRHPHQLHAWGTHLQNGHNKVDTGHQGSDTGYLERHGIEVIADARAVLLARQREVGGPAGIRRTADDKAQVKQHGAAEEQPEAQGVQLGIRYIAGPDLQRDNYIHESDQHRHSHKENHHHTVGGEDFVIMLRVQKLHFRPGGLDLHHQTVHTAAEEHSHT